MKRVVENEVAVVLYKTFVGLSLGFLNILVCLVPFVLIGGC